MTTTSPTSIVRNGKYGDYEGRINGVLVFTDTNRANVERVLANLSDTDVAPAEPIAAAPALPAYVKSIDYDRENRDYALRLNGELVGFARTYQEGEDTLNELVYELLKAEQFIAADEQAERDAEDDAIELDAMIEAILERDADDSPGGDRGARDAARLAGYSWRAA